ncbi:MAG: hypothetical protein HRT69_16000 [Flavobacteriaceae bacterium]|nr:hypothetical protein [Flavobacteriaceae bacterium]
MLKNILIKTTCNTCRETLATDLQIVKFIPGTITPENENIIAENLPNITVCNHCSSKAIVHTYSLRTTVSIQPKN